jgi:hypothetical protein
MSEIMRVRLSELFVQLYKDSKAYCDYYDIFPGVSAEDKMLVAYEKGMKLRFNRMRTRVEKIEKIIKDAEKYGDDSSDPG